MRKITLIEREAGWTGISGDYLTPFPRGTAAQALVAVESYFEFITPVGEEDPARITTEQYLQAVKDRDALNLTIFRYCRQILRGEALT